jgi:hypothetical protein
MQRKTIVTIFWCVALLGIAAAAYQRGKQSVWLAEYEMYQEDLIQIKYFKTNEPSALTEFMKGRYYYLANRISSRDLGNPYDFGPVDTNISHIGVGKGPTTPQHEYDLFKEKDVTFKIPMPNSP